MIILYSMDPKVPGGMCYYGRDGRLVNNMWAAHRFKSTNTKRFAAAKEVMSKFTFVDVVEAPCTVEINKLIRNNRAYEGLTRYFIEHHELELFYFTQKDANGNISLGLRICNKPAIKQIDFILDISNPKEVDAIEVKTGTHCNIVHENNIYEQGLEEMYQLVK